MTAHIHCFMSIIKYNPEYDLSHSADDVNFRMQHLRIADLLTMIDSGKLDLFEDDEVLRNCLDSWTVKRKSLFIESLMIKIPTPLFYIDGSQQKWKVVDGIKRLIAVIDFVRGKYALKELEYLKRDCENCTFHQLYGYLASRIMEAEIMVYIINPGTPKEVRYNIYQRLNQDRRGIDWDKIENVFFRELSSYFISPLSEKTSFRNIIGPSEFVRNLDDRYYIMVFIAFNLSGYERYAGNMDIFISDALLKLNFKDKDQLNKLDHDFCRSIKRYCLLFIHDIEYSSFYKKILDALLWNLSQLSMDEFEELRNNKREFIRAFHQLEESEEMHHLQNSSGSYKNKIYVRRRFSVIRKIIEQYIY